MISFPLTAPPASTAPTRQMKLKTETITTSNQDNENDDLVYLEHQETMLQEDDNIVPVDQEEKSDSHDSISQHKGSWERRTVTIKNQTLAVWVDTQHPSHMFRDCRRTVDGSSLGYYPNRITYHEGWRGGMRDRRIVLRELTQLAHFLCAHLVIDRPKFMLVPKHNFNQKVHGALEWNDFYQFPPWFPVDDDEDNTDDDSTATHKVLLSRKEAAASLSSLMKPDTVNVVQQLVTTKSNFTNEGIVEKLDEFLTMSLDSTANNNKSFHWEISAVYLDGANGFRTAARDYFQQLATTYQTDLLLHLDNDASFLQTKLGDNIAQAATTLSSRLVQQYSSTTSTSITGKKEVIMGTWHIRRGDSTQYCDTSLERMERFVNCSFKEFKNRTDVEVVVLLRTDERKKQYRKGLFALFDRFDNVHALDYDAWIDQQLSNNNQTDFVWPDTYDNNYHHFLLEDETLPLMPLKFSMQHRREVSCLDCANVAQLSGLVNNAKPPGDLELEAAKSLPK